MKLRTVAKLGVILSVILFCIGVGGYSFLQLSLAKEGKDIGLLEFVPDDCVGLIETDNYSYIVNELPQTAYAFQMERLGQIGLLTAVTRYFNRLNLSDGVHGLSNRMNLMMMSFHAPLSPDNVVIYFRMAEHGKNLLRQMAASSGKCVAAPRQEDYRGKTIEVYPLVDGQFVAAYSGKGFLVVSHQKRLVERVIDAQKDGTSLMQHPQLERRVSQEKSANYLTLYGRTSSLPLLDEGQRSQCWCEFDLHFNSEVFYMSGAMWAPDSCRQQLCRQLEALPPVREDSVVIVAGQQQVDACIAEITARPQHTLFDECVANLSRDASYVMVADMEKVAQSPQRYAPFLPAFLLERIDLFRPFILSVQLTKVGSDLSHIFVFTYKY